MIQLKNALHVQPIETTLHITFYPILFINLSQKFPTKTSRKKPQPLVSNTAQKLISRYIRDTSHSYILKINSPISQRYHHSSSSQQFHSPTDATTVPSVFKERKRGEYSLERIEISSNHFATPTSNTFAVIPISHGWNSPRRSINQPDKRDGFEAQTEEKVEGEKIRTCAHVCLPPLSSPNVSILWHLLIKSHSLPERCMKIVSTIVRLRRSRSRFGLCK